jgi:Arc/MetJ-type ribon-helix-helix transcriptional regulator
MIQTKIQIEPKDYEFIKKAYRKLHYRSLSEYVRDALAAKIKSDRKILREKRRIAAMTMLDGTRYENVFQSIEGDDFEKR